MSRLVDKYESFRKDLNFIKKYAQSVNAASASEVDANSNVSNKNIATMAPEIHKKANIKANRLAMYDKLTELYGTELADEYLRQLEEHEIYRHDESGMPVGTPYTYSGKESVVVYDKYGAPILTSLQSLYDRCEEQEVMVDAENMVFQKRPSNLYIADIGGRTKVTVLTKKKRHRDLVMVKTKYGENVIVTDNHPMIINDNDNDTVEAKDVLGHCQYRIPKELIMDSTRAHTGSLSIPKGERYRYYVVHKSGNYSHVSFPSFNMDENLGYFLGFFIAEGWYRTDARNGSTVMMIKVKGDKDLHACADALYLSTGIAATISGYEDERGFKTLTVSHPDFVQFCRETLDLGTSAPEKKLPRTIFEYGDDFKIGLICGLVDGDGTWHGGRFLVRLSSRTCISQLATVLHYLGVPVSMSYQDTSEKEGALIQSCYPLFSVEFPATEMFARSRKYNANEQQKFSKYQPFGWVEVTNVIPITNKYYLRDSNFIYDITTESHTFNMNCLHVHNCASITLYPFLFDGMKKIGGTTSAPHHLKSFIGGFINLVFAVSAQLCGAVATPEFLAYMDYFIRKEYGNDYYLKADETIANIQGQTVKQVIEDYFGQVVYSLNQPAAARGSQSVFWNCAYFDHPYFEQLFDGFVFPDGDEMQWESVSWLQKTFMKWFNAERLKNILTFPVETLSLLNDGNDFVDQEWADFAAEMYAAGHSFFTYTSDSVDSLASCCFSGETRVLAKSSSFVFLNTTIEKLHLLPSATKHNLTVFHNGSWVPAKTIELPARKMYSVKTANKKQMVVTDNHLWPTLDGLKRTDELTTDDWLMFNTRALDAVPEKDRKLTYAQGVLIGMYLGDGSIEVKNGIYKTVHYSLNQSKYNAMIGIMTQGLMDCGIEKSFTLREIQHNTYPLSLYGTDLSSFIEEYVCTGTAECKRLKGEVMLQSQEFRRGILDGFYATDGGNSNRIYTTSGDLAIDMEALCSTLGLCTIVDMEDRTDEPVIIRNQQYTRNYPLYCIRWYNPQNKRSMGDVYKVVNNSMYFKIISIAEVEQLPEKVYCFECKNENEPYFTLPNGVITHNCRLRNGIQDNQFSYTLGAGGVSTGSKCVMTININRLIQNAKMHAGNRMGSFDWISDAVSEQVEKIHQYLRAFNEIVKEMRDAHMISIYDAGFIAPEKQYLTVGINGLVEGAEFLGLKITNNPAYNSYVNAIMEPIYRLNKRDRTDELMWNCEMVPAENLGVKNAAWDKKDGYYVPRSCYNSYFYLVEDPGTNILDKLQLHGKQFTQFLDGGSACHLNLDEHLTKDQYSVLLRYAIKTGCNYFTFNVPNTLCNDCGYISKHRLEKCPKCGSENLDYATRIIGYLTLISKWSEERKHEAASRYYDNKGVPQNDL